MYFLFTLRHIWCSLELRNGNGLSMIWNLISLFLSRWVYFLLLLTSFVGKQTFKRLHRENHLQIELIHQLEFWDTGSKNKVPFKKWQISSVRKITKRVCVCLRVCERERKRERERETDRQNRTKTDWNSRHKTVFQRRLSDSFPTHFADFSVWYKMSGEDLQDLPGLMPSLALREVGLWTHAGGIKGSQVVNILVLFRRVS